MHDFKGKHYLASFRDCDVIDAKTIVQVFELAIKNSGAKIVNYTEHIFENGAITCVFLLSESHMSNHTYPEYKSMFVDFFTCGDTCNHEKFHETVLEGIKPKEISAEIILRF